MEARELKLGDNVEILSNITNRLCGNSRIADSYITHNSGIMTIYEYARKIEKESARILEWIKWEKE